MKGIDIYSRFSYLSKLVANFDFENYSSENKKELFIIKIEAKQKKYIPLYGDNIENIVVKANTRFVDSRAGFITDIKNIPFLATDRDAHMLLISDGILESSKTEIDTILIHEFSHFLIMSGSVERVIIEESAKELGERLYKATDFETEMLTQHSLSFCILLSQLSINYQNATNAFTENWDAVKSAMRFDIRNQ